MAESALLRDWRRLKLTRYITKVVAAIEVVAAIFEPKL